MTYTFYSTGQAEGYTAGEAIALGKVVSLDTGGNAKVGTAATEANVIGVARGGDYVGQTGQTEGVVASGNRVAVGLKGIYRVTAGGTINPGAAVQAGNNGTVVTIAAGKTLGTMVKNAAVSSGEEALVLL